ncbi:MAG: hypothetical protein JHC95_03760 [Solirubrobacteraceae bacterium]|nr:hypothetical protein [Solirubrobacteraceae bacterium]
MDDPKTPKEDPRGKDVGDGGYPEENQPGTSPGADRDRSSGGDKIPDSPDGDPGQATGNPDNAGAD